MLKKQISKWKVLLVLYVYELFGLYKKSRALSMLACGFTNILWMLYLRTWMNLCPWLWVLIECCLWHIPASLCRVYPCFAGVISRFQTSMLVWWVHLNLLKVLCHAIYHANCHGIFSHVLFWFVFVLFCFLLFWFGFVSVYVVTKKLLSRFSSFSLTVTTLILWPWSQSFNRRQYSEAFQW